MAFNNETVTHKRPGFTAEAPCAVMHSAKIAVVSRKRSYFGLKSCEYEAEHKHGGRIAALTNLQMSMGREEQFVISVCVCEKLYHSLMHLKAAPEK